MNEYVPKFEGKFSSPAASLGTVSCDHLETKNGEARDVPFTRLVVVIDDKCQRPARNVARAAALHVGIVWNFRTVVQTIQRNCTRLLGADTDTLGRATLESNFLRAVPLASS